MKKTKPLSEMQEFVNALRHCLGLGALYHKEEESVFRPEIFSDNLGTSGNSGRRRIQMRVPYAYTEAEQATLDATPRPAPKGRKEAMQKKNKSSAVQSERVGRQYRQPRGAAS